MFPLHLISVLQQYQCDDGFGQHLTVTSGLLVRNIFSTLADGSCRELLQRTNNLRFFGLYSWNLNFLYLLLNCEKNENKQKEAGIYLS